MIVFVVHTVLHIAFVVLMPPLLLGVVNKVKALFAGRVGPPVLQPYYDLARLFRKGSVFSTTTSWVFRAGPVVGLVTVLFASLLVPLGAHSAPLAFAGDVILFAYLFGLARFFTVAAALDTGSAFEGMGGAREVTYACLAEPALFLGFIVLARQAGSISLTGMLGEPLTRSWMHGSAALVLVLASMFIVMLAESSRIPFDDPNTHLELTMIHEVMVLDHSGPAFGVILYGAALKLFVLGAVVVRLAIPFSVGNSIADWAVFGVGMVALAAVVGVVESTMARLRLSHIPRLLITACLLSAFGIVLLVR